MKTSLAFIITALCLTFASVGAADQEEKGETVDGFVEAVDGHCFTFKGGEGSRVLIDSVGLWACEA